LPVSPPPPYQLFQYADAKHRCFACHHQALSASQASPARSFPLDGTPPATAGGEDAAEAPLEEPMVAPAVSPQGPTAGVPAGMGMPDMPPAAMQQVRLELPIAVFSSPGLQLLPGWNTGTALNSAVLGLPPMLTSNHQKPTRFSLEILSL